MRVPEGSILGLPLLAFLLLSSQHGGPSPGKRLPKRFQPNLGHQAAHSFDFNKSEEQIDSAVKRKLGITCV